MQDGSDDEEGGVDGVRVNGDSGSLDIAIDDL